MTCKIKRRSLRCGGRPKADFGSLFTSVIAPALNATGSIVDESIDNNKTATSGVVNSNTTIPSDPTKTPTMRLGGRKKCWIGAAIGAATSIAGSLFGAGAQKREMRRQKSIQDWQTATKEAAAMSSALNNSRDYQEDYLRQFRTAARLGKTLGAKGIYITDGGDATKIGNNTYLLLGGSHEDVNETGQTGIGINVGGNEIEAEGGEVAQKKNGALRIFSAQPILSNGMSPAQAILRGYNKDKVFSQQQAFKKRNGLNDDGNKARHGTAVPYKRIHINEDGTFTDTLTGKVYNTSATNGEDVVITGKVNHWKEAGKKDTSSYFDPMGAVNFITAAGAPILNANPSNIVGSIRDSKNASDFLKHYMMQDTGGFVNTEWSKEHPYLSLGINTIGDIGLGIGTNKAVDILRHPLEYGKYGYKLNKLYKKAGFLNRGEYKTIQENYEKLLDYYTGKRPYDEGASDFNYEIMARNNAEHVNPDIFHSYVTPSKGERAEFSRAYRKKATDNMFTEMHTPMHYGFDFGKRNDVKTYEDLMNHNPEYYEFLKETRLPWDEQSTVDAFLKRQQTSLRGVYADNKDDAVRYLTQILARRKGGDRLNTHDGLYTSNSTGIADAFKNPDDGISNGYIGKLLYDFDIDKTKPIADQLRQARMKIVRGGHNNVFAGSKYYNESINDARRKGAVAVEDNYGRSNGDVLNVTERAYFPGSAKQNKLTLQNLEEYLAQENQRGRWNTNGVDKMKGDEELFIPREYNRFDDFIREARIFMKPRREYNSYKEQKFMEELADRMWARSKYRNSLIDMSRRLRRRNEPHSTFFDVNKKIPLMDFYEPLMDSYGPFRFGGRCKLRNGGLTSKDRGSSKHPYPSVSSKDFAGGGRSYPIPTKADAVDALRLAGLHGRSDVKDKVYSRYPELRKKAEYGVNIDPYGNYSTTYKNKTSRGNKLSIRNGVVFLNNKRSPKGYKWFDKGNSTTYLVGNDGRFSIYQIHGKKPLERIDFNDDNYVAEANSRLELYNDSPNLPLYKADAQVWKDVLAKDKLERKHIIPNRLPNVRSIKLNTKEIQTNNKGKKFSNFKGVEIPTNLIDSVYKWTKEANQPLVNGFGLLGETNAGNTAPMSEDPNTKGYSNKVVRNNSGRYVSYIRPTELVNHHQFWLGPTSNLINHLIRKGKVKDNIFELGSNAINYLPTDASYIEEDKKTYNEVNNALRYIKKDTSNPNPFINALDYFKTGKYHIDKNYNNKVKERGRDFMTDKNVINRINYLRKRHTLGGCSRPVKGMRPKAAKGIYIPFNKRYTSIYDAPDYDSDYNGGNVLGNGEVTVTAKRIKPTFMKSNNDAMNIINHPANETPYIPQRHNRSRAIFSGGDYLGLGIDTLAALSTGLVNYNTAGKYVLPDRAPIIQASKLPTTYNVNPEIEEVKRYRDRLTGQTFNNTSSSVAALNRSGAINLDALSNLSKLWATKENEENKMLTEDAKNQQTVAAQNVQNELARQSEIARIKNEATQAKGDALNVGLSGLSQAWTNFWTAGRTAYEDDQSRRAMIASSKEATPTRLSEMDFDLSPDILASLYRTSKDDRTKRFYLSRLSPKQRLKYGIN